MSELETAAIVSEAVMHAYRRKGGIKDCLNEVMRGRFDSTGSTKSEVKTGGRTIGVIAARTGWFAEVDDEGAYMSWLDGQPDPLPILSDDFEDRMVSLMRDDPDAYMRVIDAIRAELPGCVVRRKKTATYISESSPCGEGVCTPEGELIPGLRKVERYGFYRAFPDYGLLSKADRKGIVSLADILRM